MANSHAERWRAALRGSRFRTLTLIGLAVAGLSAVAGPSSPLAAQESPADRLEIGEHVFPNGLRLLVLERPGDPRVESKIFTRFGALVEEPGELGSAHFLEHLMFKGTEMLGTTDWAAERPIRERIDATELALIEALNRSRNDLRERGVFHDFKRAESTPEIDSLRAEIQALEREASAFRDNGSMMRWYQAFGGTGLTATTEQEYMKFDINLPRERVELFLRVEADRMSSTVFREFDQERMILVEQRYGDLNRPTTPFYEALDATVGSVHPVYWNEGYETDFYQYTRSYQRDLYERYFVPNNTTLVFVGGVSLEEMIPLVDRYFGAMERRPEPMREKAVQPLPEAERRMVWRSNDLAPRVDVRHRIPGIGHPDRPAFDVLAELLADEIRGELAAAGVSGRVNVNTRVVHTTRFGVPATLNAEVVVGAAAVDRAEAAVLNAMDDLSRSAVDPARLQHAKKRLRAAWYRSAADAGSLAFDIGHFATMDRWTTLVEHLRARDAVSAEDVTRLASRYFVPENRTTGVVRPEAEQ